jgi:S1-C subfamily serine protease
MRRVHSAFAVLLAVQAVCLQAQQFNLENARAGALASTFRIRAERPQTGGESVFAHGTAFAVDLSAYGCNKPRYVLTAYHVVRETAGSPTPLISIESMTGEEPRWLACKTLSFNVRMDIALIECESDLPYRVDISKLAKQEPPVGRDIALVASPGGAPVSLYKGSVSEINFDRSVISVPFGHGCSGSPVFDGRSFELLGVAVAGKAKGTGMDPEIGLFITSAGIEWFLKRNLPEKPAPIASSTPAQSIQSEPSSDSSIETAATEK